MYATDPSLSSSGALSAGVPGEVAGYWAARRRHGNSSISWRRILQPSIDMARQGTPVSPTLASSIKDKQWRDRTLAETFTNPDTGRAWVAGDLYKRPRLADTLETLAEAGEDGDALFYRGALGEALVGDLQKLGGKIVMEDLANYSPAWQPALSVALCRCGTAPRSTTRPGTTSPCTRCPRPAAGPCWLLYSTSCSSSLATRTRTTPSSTTTWWRPSSGPMPSGAS